MNTTHILYRHNTFQNLEWIPNVLLLRPRSYKTSFTSFINIITQFYSPPGRDAVYLDQLDCDNWYMHNLIKIFFWFLDIMLFVHYALYKNSVFIFYYGYTPGRYLFHIFISNLKHHVIFLSSLFLYATISFIINCWARTYQQALWDQNSR